MDVMYILGLLTFLVSSWDSVDACSCFPSHIQTQFCRSDYVYVITIKKVEEIYSNNEFKQTNRIPEGPVYPFPIRRKFKARVHRAFKSGNMTTRDITIHTPGSDAACGIKLDLKKKYLIGGYSIEGDHWVNLCGLVQEYKTLNRQQIKGLKFFYKKHCSCKISWCSGTFCRNGYNTRDTHMCKWEPRFSNDCYVRHSYCVEDKSKGKCFWKRNKKFKTCLMTNDEQFPWRKPVEVVPPFEEENKHSPGYNSWP